MQTKNIKLLLYLITDFEQNYVRMTSICKVTTSKFTAKLLLLFHSENYIKLNFVVVSHFWPGCFAPPYLLRPGATAPLCPLCYATALQKESFNYWRLSIANKRHAAEGIIQ